MKRLLTIFLFVVLAISGMGLAGKVWLMGTDSGARWILNRVTVSLEEQLAIGQLEGNFDDGLLLNNVRFEQSGLRVEITRIETTVDLAWLPLQLNIKTLNMQDVSVWKAVEEDTPSGRPVAVGGISEQDISVQGILEALQLPIVIDMEDVEISGFNLLDSAEETLLHFDEVSLSGRWADEIQIRHLSLGSPEFDGSIHGRISLSPPFKHQWTGSIKLPPSDAYTEASGQFELKGLPDDYKLSLTASLSPVDLPVIQLAAKGQGGLEQLDIDQGELDSEFAQAAITGRADWSEQAAVGLELDIKRIDPSMWVDNWPGDGFVYGKMSFMAEDSVIRVQAFDFDVSGTDMAIKGSADLDLLAGVIDGTLEWQNLAWPPGPSSLISSDHGQLNLSGVPGDWQFEGMLDLDTPEYPGGRFELAGNGDTHSAGISILTGQALGGTLAGQAEVDWKSALRWSAALDVEQLDVSTLLQDWPARLNGQFQLSQDTGTDVFELQFENLLGVLQGEFEGLSVTGQGGLVIDTTGMHFKNIQLLSGQSKLDLDGNLKDPDGLSFLVSLYPEDRIAGHVNGEIKGRGQVAPFAPQPLLDVEIDVRDLTFGEMVLQVARIELSGDHEFQTLDLSIQQGDYELEARLGGVLSDWNTLVDNEWVGKLEKLSLVSAQQGYLSLRDTAALSLSAGQMSLPAILSTKL